MALAQNLVCLLAPRILPQQYCQPVPLQLHTVGSVRPTSLNTALDVITRRRKLVAALSEWHLSTVWRVLTTPLPQQRAAKRIVAKFTRCCCPHLLMRHREYCAILWYNAEVCERQPRQAEAHHTQAKPCDGMQHQRRLYSNFHIKIK